MDFCFGNKACQDRAALESQAKLEQAKASAAAAASLGQSSGLSTGAIVGISFGALVILGLVVWLIFRKRG